MKLQNKTVVITGGSGGIGSHITGLVIKAGGTAVIIDRVAPAFGEFIQGDLSSLHGISAVADALRQRKPDVLINLAGIQYFGFLEKQSPEHIAMMMAINLVAPILLCQAVLPGMKKRGSGQIVNIGSVFGSIPFAHFVTYSSTKAGLKAFSQSLRRELTGSGIVVTHISPRAVKTALNDAKIMKLAEHTNMTMDAPEMVARRIVQAIEADAKDVVIGAPESVFTRINALLPSMIDKALAKNDLIAREILSH